MTIEGASLRHGGGSGNQLEMAVIGKQWCISGLSISLL